MEEKHWVETVPLAESHTYSPSSSRDLLDLSCTSMEVVRRQSNLKGREATQHHLSLDTFCLANGPPKPHT